MCAKENNRIFTILKLNNDLSAETQLTEYAVKEGEVLKQLNLVTISKREVELVCSNHSEWVSPLSVVYGDFIFVCLSKFWQYTSMTKNALTIELPHWLFTARVLFILQTFCFWCIACLETLILLTVYSFLSQRSSQIWLVSQIIASLFIFNKG